MKITFLGTGTSTGVPQLGCDCEVCTSSNSRDRRLRTSALLEVCHDFRILFDCGPDFREQMLREGFADFRAVLITHEHYDHVGGLDDLRPYSFMRDMPVYADSLTAKHLRERLPYCFGERIYPGAPRLVLHEIAPGHPFDLYGVEILPLQAMHGKMPILCYRIGDMAYLTDVSSLPSETLIALSGVKFLVVNALRKDFHHSHQTLDDAIAIARILRPSHTYFIHMSHHMGLHDEVERGLPEGMHLAYDGLQVLF